MPIIDRPSIKALSNARAGVSAPLSCIRKASPLTINLASQGPLALGLGFDVLGLDHPEHDTLLEQCPSMATHRKEGA